MILRRLPESRFSEVLPAWVGRTVVLMGGGPSLTAQQVELVAGAHAAEAIHVIAVNDSFLLAPWADAHYAADSHWHRWMTEGIDKPALGLTAEQVRAAWASFAGEKCTIQNSGANVTDEAVHMLRNRDHPVHGIGLSLDPQYLVTGRNSGFQALNLAVLARAARVILLGFDARLHEDGRSHFHGGHPRPTPREAYPLYRAAMVAAESALDDAGVEVINATPGSAIDCFGRMDLEVALAHG